jgi:hypothetical protein
MVLRDFRMLIRTQYKVWASGHVLDAIGNFETIDKAERCIKARGYTDAEIVRVEYHSITEEKSGFETIKEKFD